VSRGDVESVCTEARLPSCAWPTCVSCVVLSS
jgi:hypothetical protein